MLVWLGRCQRWNVKCLMFCCVFVAVVTSGGSCYRAAVFFPYNIVFIHSLLQWYRNIKYKPINIYVFSTHFWIHLQCIHGLHCISMFFFSSWAFLLLMDIWSRQGSEWRKERGNGIWMWSRSDLNLNQLWDNNSYMSWV